MKKHDILLAYDDPQMLEVIGFALEDRGCQVTAVSSGDEAMDLLDKKQFDVVLTDLTMSPADGVSVLRKSKDLNPGTMVILLLCEEKTPYDEDNLPAGFEEADEYVFKPCGISKLWKRVSNCLERLELRKKTVSSKDRIEQLREEITKISKNISEDVKGQLVFLSQEMTSLKQGAYGEISGNATTKLDELLKVISELAGDTDALLREISLPAKI